MLSQEGALVSKVHRAAIIGEAAFHPAAVSALASLFLPQMALLLIVVEAVTTAAHTQVLLPLWKGSFLTTISPGEGFFLMGLLSVPNTSVIAFSLAHGPGHRQVLFSGGYRGWLGDDC